MSRTEYDFFDSKIPVDKYGQIDPLACIDRTQKICDIEDEMTKIEVLIKDADINNNYCSMWELVQIYHDRECMQEYKYWLERIYSESWQFAEALRLEKQDQYMQNPLYFDAIIWSSVLIPAYDELGLITMSDGNPASINKAISIFKALDCYYYDANSRIREAEELLSKQNELQKNGTLVSNDATVDLKNEIGIDAWNVLLDDSKVYINTAQYVFTMLNALSAPEQKNIDFSCVILPLMKALELELKQLFSYKYLKYLTDVNMTARRYCEINSVDYKKIKKEWPFYKSDNEFLLKISDFTPVTTKIYPSAVAKFTLGNLAYIVGRKKEKDNISFYNSAIDFCKWLGVKKPQRWLKYVTESVDMLIHQRNASAHAGKIETIMDLNYCLDKMFFINKLIRNIVLLKAEDDLPK